MPWLQNYGTAVSWFDMTKTSCGQRRLERRLKAQGGTASMGCWSQTHTTPHNRSFEAIWCKLISHHLMSKPLPCTLMERLFFTQGLHSGSCPTGHVSLTPTASDPNWCLSIVDKNAWHCLEISGHAKLRGLSETQSLTWATDGITCLGKMASPNVGGSPPIGSEDSLSSFKSHVCRSRQERSKGGLFAQPQKIQVLVVSPPPTPPVTTLMKQKTVKKTSTPGQPCNWSNWNGNLDGLFASKTWQIRSTP